MAVGTVTLPQTAGTHHCLEPFCGDKMPLLGSEMLLLLHKCADGGNIVLQGAQHVPQRHITVLLAQMRQTHIVEGGGGLQQRPG